MTVTWTVDQDRAINAILDFLADPRATEFVLSGYAGTGKSTLLREVVRRSPLLRWGITAPTNKATRVIRGMTKNATAGTLEVATTYSFLGLKLAANGEVKQIQASGNTKAAQVDVLVVDEASMVNPRLRNEILTAARLYHLKVLYVGDPLQLPPVGYEASCAFSVDNGAALTEIVRQQDGNPIIEATAHLRECIKQGALPRFATAKSKHGGLYVLGENKWEHWLKAGFNSPTYRDRPEAFRALAWTNKRVNSLNRNLRRLLYQEQANQRFVEGERVLAAAPVILDQDDGVLMTTDEEATVERVEVMPHPVLGERYIVYGLALTTDEGRDATAAVIHEDSYADLNKELTRRAAAAKGNSRLWASYWQFHDLFHDIRPGHALTVHRSQGSTYDNVFVDVGDILQNSRRQEALQCLYVAVSRAATNVMLTGAPQ